MSSRIIVLPSHLINQIAAGEVIERPASIVKELVENAIDAKASIIEVELWDAGKKKIVIRDNGEGMGAQDLKLCIERHATSKINHLDDLLKVKTLGFRGEALPSIASVSRMTLKSKDETSLEGCYLKLDGGEKKEENICGIPKGTEIIVEDIFFNTPARLKFLKSTQTELGHCVEAVEQLALVYPSVSFRLRHEGKEIFSYIKARSFKERILDVLNEKGENFLAIENSFKEWSLKGLIGFPHYMTGSGQSCYFFVNGRPIRDRTMLHAVMTAYQSYMPHGNYPKVVLFFETYGEDVDVNVHPTKKEVRFKETHLLHSFISNSLKATLERGGRKHMTPPSEFPPMQTAAEDGLAWCGESRQAVRAHEAHPRAGADDAVSNGGMFRRGAFNENVQPPHHVQLSEAISFFNRFTYIGQLKNSYLLFQDEQNLIFIDQHAAHERVVFERLKRQYNKKAIDQQYLLIPQVLEFSASEIQWVKALIPSFNQLGFQIELFGDTTCVVKSVPALIQGKITDRMIQSMLAELKEMPKTMIEEELINHVLSTVACHSARTANEKLEKEEVQTLLLALDHLEAAPHCPHGRPFSFSLPIDTIEKKFRR